jgi:hypothetical protein
VIQKGKDQNFEHIRKKMNVEKQYIQESIIEAVREQLFEEMQKKQAIQLHART